MPTANENEENITKYYLLPMVAEKLQKENYVERIRTSQSFSQSWYSEFENGSIHTKLKHLNSIGLSLSK